MVLKKTKTKLGKSKKTKKRTQRGGTRANRRYERSKTKKWVASKKIIPTSSGTLSMPVSMSSCSNNPLNKFYGINCIPPSATK